MSKRWCHHIISLDIKNLSVLGRHSASRYKRQSDITLNDIAILQYTGGTTGVAKGAMLTHRNIVANLIHNTFLGDD